jgi:hypothetical protein
MYHLNHLNHLKCQFLDKAQQFCKIMNWNIRFHFDKSVVELLQQDASPCPKLPCNTASFILFACLRRLPNPTVMELVSAITQSQMGQTKAMVANVFTLRKCVMVKRRPLRIKFNDDHFVNKVITHLWRESPRDPRLELGAHFLRHKDQGIVHQVVQIENDFGLSAILTECHE